MGRERTAGSAVTSMEADARKPGAPDAGEGAGVQPQGETSALSTRKVYPATGERGRFYSGVIAEVNWGRGTGVVRSGNGRDIPFDFPLVVIVGERRRIEHLHPGMRVGFDVGRTSKGLRITHLKIFD